MPGTSAVWLTSKINSLIFGKAYTINDVDCIWNERLDWQRKYDVIFIKGEGGSIANCVKYVLTVCKKIPYFSRRSDFSIPLSIAVGLVIGERRFPPDNVKIRNPLYVFSFRLI